MTTYNMISEGRSTPVIVVDVQPAYTGILDGDELPWVDDMMEFLNKQGDILLFANAERDQLTNDTITGVKEYWTDSGYDDRKWQQTTIDDKGYGYLRGWMDQYEDDRLIIRTIREMYRQKKYDSRDLFDGDEYKMIKFGIPEDLLDEPLSVEWTSMAQLKRHSGGYLMGGGENECLREITLMMNAFNMRYKLVRDFIY